MPTTPTNRPTSTVDIHYKNGCFVYGRSTHRIINPVIDITSALRQLLFYEEPVDVGCFVSLFKKRKPSPAKRLRPNGSESLKHMAEKDLIELALRVLFVESFTNPQAVKLCLELTKHPYYQNRELNRQGRKKVTNQGYLSALSSAQQVARRFYKIFKCRYADLNCAEIEFASSRASHQHRSLHHIRFYRTGGFSF